MIGVGGRITAPVLLVAVVVATGVVIAQNPHQPPFQAADASWRHLMLETRTPLLTHAATLAHALGRFPVWLAAAALITGWYALRRRWWAAGYLLAVTAVSTLMTRVLKMVVLRPRPAEGMVLVGVAAYPSGHVVHATTTVLAVVLLAGPAARRRYGWPAVVAVAGWMGWSRTYLSVHWLSDVLAGAALAAGVCLLGWRCCAVAVEREAGRPPTGATPPPPGGPSHPGPTAHRG